jgi:hypothetical protein
MDQHHVLQLCERLVALSRVCPPGLPAWTEACAQTVNELRSEMGQRVEDVPLSEKLAELERKCEGLGERSTNATCCDPRFVRRDEKGEPVAWTITLNEYQRSNLLWLLCDIAGYDRKEAVVPQLQTGDWAGEVPNALRCHERDFKYEESARAPNVSPAEARRWIDAAYEERFRARMAEAVAAARRQAIHDAVQAISGVPDEELGVSAAVALSRAIVCVNALVEGAPPAAEQRS